MSLDILSLASMFRCFTHPLFSTRIGFFFLGGILIGVDGANSLGPFDFGSLVEGDLMVVKFCDLIVVEFCCVPYFVE